MYPNERDKKIPPAKVFARDNSSVFCEKFLFNNGIPQHAIFNKDNMICKTSLRAGKLNSNFGTATVAPPLHDNKPFVLIHVLSFLCKPFSMTLTFGVFIILDDDEAMSKYVTSNNKITKHNTVCIILSIK